jgi:gamma-glutamyltranspeptidase / glutathione hydrolase
MTAAEVMAEQCTGRGARGVVCAAAPLAAAAGADALRAGGNAYDAVVAAALAETVLLPSKCGLGGDLVAIVSSAGAEPEALLAIGGAPAGLAAVAASGTWRDVGPHSVGPPAAPAGYAALADRGRLGRAALAARAVELAETGFPWAAVNEDLSRAGAALVAEMHPDGCRFYPDGAPIPAGSIVTLAGHAALLREFVDRGEALLDGPVGEAIVHEVQSRGGVLAASDFAFARAEWAPCAPGRAGHLAAWATPVPTHGPSLLEAAAAINAESTQADVYRAMIAAIAARRDALADPSGTSMVSAVDADGTAVVMVHSNSYPRWGSGIIVADYDLCLANRAGRGFTAEVGHPNFPVAGRRPATTLHAWAVADETGAVRYLGATPGGDNQMPWNTQTLAQIVAGEHRPGRLVTSPRWEWLPADDGVRLEAGFDDDTVAALRAAAPRTLATSQWGLKSAQQVVRVPRAGEAIEGAADPRTVGAAVGV